MSMLKCKFFRVLQTWRPDLHAARQHEPREPRCCPRSPLQAPALPRKLHQSPRGADLNPELAASPTLAARMMRLQLPCVATLSVPASMALLILEIGTERRTFYRLGTDMTDSERGCTRWAQRGIAGQLASLPALLRSLLIDNILQ